MKKEEILFTKYKMVVEGNEIENVLTKSDKGTKFSYTFYEENQVQLDVYENILDFVKPKVERERKNSIIINLDNLTCSYSSNGNALNEEDIKLAIGLLKNALSDSNEEVKELKELLEKTKRDIEGIEKMSASSEPMKALLAPQLASKNKEIEEIKAKIEEVLTK